MPASRRLDIALVERGIAETRSKAQALVLAGSVLVDGEVAARAGQTTLDSQHVSLRARPRFVGRGGEKLQHALDTFAVNVERRVCADIGASTGGFTDCLLQAGALRVYAIDVGYGQLDLRLRSDPRVVVMERTNARYLETLPEPVSLVTIDVSFISLRLILPVAAKLLATPGDCIMLIKPQFEAGRSQVGKRGVVSDPAVHREVLFNVLDWASGAGFQPKGLTPSPLKGPEGNIEFLLHVSSGGASVNLSDARAWVSTVVPGV